MGLKEQAELLLLAKADTNDMSLGIARLINDFAAMRAETDRGEKGLTAFGVAWGNILAKLGYNVLQVPINAFKTLTQKVQEFVNVAKGATMEAARIEVQWRTLSLTAGNAGKTLDDVTGYVNDLRMAGIKTGEALEIVSQFLANELPVENITELARRAQDMAVVIGRDSTEAFSRFNTFLQTGNSQWIRTMGITKTANQMLKEYADSQGLVVKALTDRQRKEALVQGLLKETMAYEGAYEEAMKDPYKRWTSLPRLISNAREALGSLFVPAMGAVVDIASDALEMIEGLFRVTKKEAKETGQTIGEWKDGFLRLRAVIQVFSNWVMTLWQRLTGGWREAGQSFMDNFVDTLVRGVQIVANALRKLAQFMARVFGGRAPAEVTAEAAARTTIAPAEPGKPREIPPVEAIPPETAMAEPKKYEKLMKKPVSPAEPTDVAQLAALTKGWADATRRLADASAQAAKARAAFSAAEEKLRAASEKVYDIRRRIEALERQWAEVPERFVRGRKRQLEVELDAAEHAEHQRQQERDAARERLQEAEEYERKMKQIADGLQRDAEKLANAIERQNEKYQDWLDQVAEASATVTTEMEQPIQGIVNEFESLDDVVMPFMEEVEGPLSEAFANIELSVQSIVSSLGAAFEKAKEIFFMVLEKLGEIKAWYDGLPEWAQNLLKGTLLVGLGFKLLGGSGALSAILGLAFKGAGLMAGTGWTIAAGAIALYIAIKPFLDEEVRAEWARTWQEIKSGEGSWFETGAGAAEKTIQKTPIMGTLMGWVDSLFKAKPEMEDAADKSLAQPIIDAANRAHGEVVGASILPDMITSILGWFTKMSEDVVPIMTTFSDNTIGPFNTITQSWTANLDKLSQRFDSLIGRVRLLTAGIKGLPPLPEDLTLFAEGRLQIVTVNLQGSNFGAGVTRGDVEDWMHEAIGGVMA